MVTVVVPVIPGRETVTPLRLMAETYLFFDPTTLPDWLWTITNLLVLSAVTLLALN